MQNKEHKIDALFRSKLGGYELTPPTEVWDRIANDLGHNRKRRRAIIIWTMSGAASLLLAFFAGWYLSGKSAQSFDKQLMAQLDAVKTEQQIHPISNEVINNQLVIHIDQPQFKPILVPESMYANNASTTSQTKRITGELAYLEPIDMSLANRYLNIPELIISEEEDFFTAADRAIIDANLLAMNTEESNAKNNTWAVGVSASPLYRFNELNLPMTKDALRYDAVQNEMPSDYQSNVSGGVSVAYETKGRIDIISGFNYSEVAQNTGNVALSFISHNWVNDNRSFEFADANVEQEVLNPAKPNNLVINTQVGMANISLPEGAEVASAKVMNSLVPEATQNYDYKQQARYVEVPLLMRYRLIEKRLGVNLLGGINTNVLVSNTVKLEDKNNVVASGKIEGLRPLSWSSSLGMGLNYELTSHLNLNFEPTLKIQLNSLNTQSYFDTRPYAFGIFSGVTYRF